MYWSIDLGVGENMHLGNYLRLLHWTHGHNHLLRGTCITALILNEIAPKSHLLLTILVTGTTFTSRWCERLIIWRYVVSVHIVGSLKDLLRLCCNYVLMLLEAPSCGKGRCDCIEVIPWGVLIFGFSASCIDVHIDRLLSDWDVAIALMTSLLPLDLIKHALLPQKVGISWAGVRHLIPSYLFHSNSILA